MPKCSVLITTYNAEKFIEYTLQSILWQTFSDIEILILDNKSQDGTIQSMKQIIGSDKRFSIVESKKNLGPYKGLKLLIDKAQGEYIAILDHDDLWHPDKLSEQIKILDQNTQYVGCGSTFVDVREGKNFCKNELVTLANVVLHSSLVFRNKGYKYNDKITRHNDRDFMVNILAQDGDIFKINKALVLRRMRNNGENISVRHASFGSLLKVKEKSGVHWYEYIYNIVRFRYFMLYRIFLFVFFPLKIGTLSTFLKKPLRKDHADFVSQTFK